MPIYEITDPKSGKTLEVEGDSPPSEQELEQIFASVNTTATTPPQQPGAISRAAGSFWEQVNPVTAVQSLATAIQHPVQTIQGIGEAQGRLGVEAAQAYQQGDYLKAARKGVNYLLPVIGPALDAQSEKGMQGDIAGMVGGTTGIAANLTAPETLRATGNALRVIPQSARTALATRLESGAAERVADVMSPKVGPNKLRLGNKAAAVAPKLLKEPGVITKTTLSRDALAANVATKLDEAETALDAAASARNASAVYPTTQILTDLKAARDKLVAQSSSVGQGGRHVVPGPNAARVAMIDQAIQEVQQLGPVAQYEALRRLRQAYDGPAKAVYSPSVTQDYLTAQGQKLGAADVTGTLRQHLAQMDPQTATANAQYSLYRSASDVLSAAEEVDRVRPKVGRQMLARGLGSATGGAISGGWGAVLGYLLAPVVDSAMSSGMTTKLATAKAMQEMGDALRAGNATRAHHALARLASVSGQSARLAQLVKQGPSVLELPKAAQDATGESR